MRWILFFTIVFTPVLSNAKAAKFLRAEVTIGNFDEKMVEIEVQGTKYTIHRDLISSEYRIYGGKKLTLVLPSEIFYADILKRD